MNVILLERIEKLGQMGDLVNVKSGFARNFLLPKGKAVFASKENIKDFEEKKIQLEGENIEKKNEASKLADSIELKEVIIIRAASEAGQLYGSVSAKDISEAMASSGLTVKTLGWFGFVIFTSVLYNLYPIFIFNNKKHL